jgi:peptidoglycan/LPS O-acetylase OafA/YrhL
MTTTTAPAPTRTRTPWTVHLLGAVVLLLAAVTSYGAYYFTFVFEDPDPGPGSWLFLLGFWTINAVAAAAAVALWRGRRWGWQVLLGYGVLGILWCIAKLVFWSEVESLVFGAANVAGLALLLAPRTRAHTSR